MHVRLFAAATTMILGGLGCGDSTTASTAGTRVVLRTAITADPTARTRFTTNFGWKVTLERAALGVGALYYFNGTPAFTQIRPSLLQQVGRFFEGTAHAHPGHYQPGDALGQMLTPSSFDLLAGERGTLPDGDGVSGTFRSARFVFAQTATGPAAGELGGHVAYARGVAEKADGTTPTPIHFELSADYADVAKQAVSGQVDGCVFAEADVSTDGTVTLMVSPSVWLNVVDFSAVAPGSSDSPTSVAVTEKAGIGFVSGLTQLDAYAFSYAP